MIHWNTLNFNKNEFSEDPDQHAEPQLIYNLNTFRIKLNELVFPSPVKGALARFIGSITSQHYAVDRKSTAVDIFCEGIPIEIFGLLYGSELFSGLGIYLDTKGLDGKPWVMFHVDIRLSVNIVPLFWIVQKGWETETKKERDFYYYPQQNKQHWSLLRNERLYTRKQFGN